MKRCFGLLVLILASVGLHADVRGTVVTTEGVPIAAASVQLHVPAPQAQLIELAKSGKAIEPAAVATTDSKGNFTIKRDVGNYALIVMASGYAPSFLSTTGAEDVGGIAMRTAATKQGRVTAGGKPLASAVLLFSSGSRARFSVRTDAEGRYTIPDPSVWNAEVTVVHPEYALLTRSVASGLPGGRSILLDHRLTTGATVSGRVTAQDGRSGARAKLLIDGVSAGESGEDGSFTVTRVPQDWKRIVATIGNQVASAPRGAHSSLRLMPALSLSGTVTDARTKLPLVGAVVALVDNFWTPGHQVAITDSKGRFTIASLRPAQWVLSVNAAGYSTFSGPQPVGPGPTTRNLQLQRDVRLAGRITDDQRNPVAGARVRIAPRGQNFFMNDGPLVSAPDGRFAARHPVRSDFNEVDVHVMRAGYAPTVELNQKYTAGEERAVNFVLTRGLALAGKVVGPDDQPLANVAIGAIERSNPQQTWSQPLRETRDLPVTDAKGEFTLRLRPATYDIYVRGTGFAPKLLRAVKVSDAMEPLEIKLVAAASISGRVVTTAGEGVPDISVSTFVEGAVFDTETDEGGAFMLTGLPATTISLGIENSDSSVQEERQVKAPAENVVIELIPTVSVSGRVMEKDSKRAISDFALELGTPTQGGVGFYMGSSQRPTRFSDSEGRFTIEKARVRPAELIVTAPGYQRATVAIELVKGKNVEGIEVLLERASRVTGRITDATGAPVEEARVTRQATGPFQMYSSSSEVRSDANGEYTIDGLPRGEVTLNFGKRSYQTVKKTLTLDAAESRLDVQLPAGLAIDGRVSNDSGAAIAAATVTAYGEGSFAREMSDASGRVRLEGLAPGIYRIEAAKIGFITKVTTDVDIQKTPELVIRMSAGATITGTVTGLPPDLLSSVTVGAAGDRQNANIPVDASGRYRMEGAPVGKIRLRAMLRSQNRSRQTDLVDLETASGGTYTADFEFTDRNTLRGRVTRRGAPMRAGSIMFSSVTPPRISSSGPISDSGEYEVAGVTSGEQYVTVTLYTENLTYRTRITVTRSATLDVDVNPATVNGRVVDASTGEPIANAEILLEPSGDASVEAWMKVSGRSGTDGRAILTNISPGSYGIRASREGYATTTAERSLREGVSADVEFSLTPTAGTTLKVMDSRTGNSVRSFVTVTDRSGRLVWQDDLEPKADGTAVVPVAPGSYRATVYAGGLALVYTNLTSPGTQQLTLRPGGRLELDNPSAAPLRGKVVAADGSDYDPHPFTVAVDFPIPNGTTWLTDMATGRYTLQLLDSSGTVTRSMPFEIKEGETSTMKL